MSTLSSFNKFNHLCLRDAIFIPFANCVTSFFAGFVIFAYMGYLSHVTGQDIDNIIQAGQGLAYVVYPHAVTTIPGAPFWAICFFFMMTLLGIDSTVSYT
jgi:SNF family Na+-dependent transporter